jgi:hypothetical protein
LLGVVPALTDAFLLLPLPFLPSSLVILLPLPPLLDEPSAAISLSGDSVLELELVLSTDGLEGETVHGRRKESARGTRRDIASERDDKSWPMVSLFCVVSCSAWCVLDYLAQAMSGEVDVWVDG